MRAAASPFNHEIGKEASAPYFLLLVSALEGALGRRDAEDQRGKAPGSGTLWAWQSGGARSLVLAPRL